MVGMPTWLIGSPSVNKGAFVAKVVAAKFGPTPGLFETIVAWYNGHKSEPVDGVAALQDAETAESSGSGHTVADPVIPEAVIPVANQPVIITMEQMKVLSALSVLVYVLYIMC